MPGWSQIASATSLPPWTRLTTPDGRPQVSSSSNIRACESGTCSRIHHERVADTTRRAGTTSAHRVKIEGRDRRAHADRLAITVQSIRKRRSQAWPMSNAERSGDLHALMARRTLPRDVVLRLSVLGRPGARLLSAPRARLRRTCAGATTGGVSLRRDTRASARPRVSTSGNRERRLQSPPGGRVGNQVRPAAEVPGHQ